MRFRKINMTLIGIMVVIAIIILTSTLISLYQVALDQFRANLTRTALSQARLLESVAVFDQKHSRDFPKGSMAATLSQIDAAFGALERVGKTGEFLLAQRQGDDIKFLLISPGGKKLIPGPVAFKSALAEPMRRALNGNGGVMTGPDYNGITVLAAYQPVKALKSGIVVKIHLAEIRAPFLKIGSILILFSGLLVTFGSALFLRVNNPVIRRIRESKQRFQRAVAGTNDGIWEWNVQTGADYFSPRWAEILGYDTRDLEPVVETFANIVHPDDRKLVWDRVNANLERDEPFDIEYRMRKENGEYIWIHCKGSTSRDDDGQPTFMAGSITDITERKLNQDKLRIAKEEAEKANLAKSEFLASMSHELRTPLNAILGFGQMLQIDPAEKLSPAQNGYVSNILTGGNRLLKLINEILDLSQIEAEQTALCIEDVNAEEAIENCITQILPLARARKIKVINRIVAGSAILIRTDRMRLEQIILNLLSNGVKYNNDNGTITVDYWKTKEEFLHISITDTGIGLAGGNHPDIFNMFQRFGSNSTIAKEGSGIGLAICKLLAEQMGGRIDYDSEQGKGSTFWVEFPLESNDNIFIWSDDLRIGVDAIDKDHQILLSLTNKISSGFCTETSLNNLITDLVEYTQYHLEREEMIMEVCGYPRLKKHRKCHQKLIDKINDLARDWHENKDPDIRHRFGYFLRDWLVTHIKAEDAKIAQYTNGKTQEIRQALKSLEKN